MADDKLVAVCGATGQQGGATVRALLKLGGIKVRGLTRNPSGPAAQKLAEQGVEVVKSDFDDVESVRAAFAGCDAVFAVTDFWVACQMDPHKEKQQASNLVDAAKLTGVKHFVFSTLEDTRPLLKGIADPVVGEYTVPHFDAKAEADQYAAQQLGSAHTSLITSIFYENLRPGGIMSLRKSDESSSYLLVLPTGDAKLAWCSTDDIGHVAAGVLAAGPGKYGGKQVPVAGDHVTVGEMAEIASRVFGKNVVAVSPPMDEFYRSVAESGAGEQVAKDLQNMFILYRDVGMIGLRPVEGSKEVYPDVQGMEAWLTQHKSEFEEFFA